MNTLMGKSMTFSRAQSKKGGLLRFHAIFMAGVDHKSVSSILGHANAAITLGVYAHFTETMGEGAARRIDGILG